MTVTWNTADKSANITLSNNNFTATASSSAVWALVRATQSQIAGLRYAEFTMSPASGSGNKTGIGVANVNELLDNEYLGGTNNSIGYYNTGSVYLNGALVATLASYAAGNVGRMAYDFLHQKIWFSVDAGGWNNAALTSQDPANNIGGISTTAIAGALFPAFCCCSLSSTVANFGGT